MKIKMKKADLKKFFPLFPTSLLLLVFILDIFTLLKISIIKNILPIRELLIVCAFSLSVIPISQAKWISDKNIAQKIKVLFISIASIYLTFFIFKIMLSPDLGQMYQNVSPVFSSLNNLLYASITAILATIFGIFILLLLRDLIYAKRKRATHRNFRIVIYVMLFQLIFFIIKSISGDQNTELTSGGAIGTILLILLIIAVVVNSFRNSWVNYLNKRQKLACFGWGLMLLPAAYVMIGLSYHKIITFYSISLGVFLRQVAVFLAIYWSLAMLSILSHLPTAGLYDRKRKEIDSLHRLSRAITLEFDPDKLVLLMTKQSMEVIEANAVWLEIIDNQTGHLSLVSANHLNQAEQQKISTYTEKEISDWILKNRTAVLINEVKHDERTQYLKDVNPDIGSLIGVPLISYDKFLGILFAIKFEEYGFEIDDRDMLQTFADQAAVALENARLVNESIIKERLEQELKVAHDAQMKLLPKTMPKIKGLDIDAICVTANEVGGDYYDFFRLAENKLAIVIGDVSGKGPEAAFYMAEVKGIIESLSKTYSSPKELLIKTNEILFDTLDNKTFVTLIYAIIDTENSRLTFSRAGHCPLIYHQASEGKTLSLEPEGLGLGLEKGEKFDLHIEEKEITFQSNDFFLFYTDGVVEARNLQQEEFGEHHLMEVTALCASLTAIKIKNKLVREVQKFEGLAKPHDDLTMVVVKIN